ncbi:MAG TPA: CocE/NonD family hydrolase [Mycobacteriales bacterium]|nr:CocE/NonD family hydrolase [Mycobacteriales bacterium]
MKLLWDVAIPLRDGVRTSADVFVPEVVPAPAILVRTPYGKQGPVTRAAAERFCAQGYVVVVQDVRGRHDSEGHWTPFVHEAADGCESVEWVAAQPWCTGQVATWGGSYLGWTQWALARERPPHLAAVASTASAGRLAEELPFDRGIPTPLMAAWLHLVGGRVQQDPSRVDWPSVLRHLPLRDLGDALGRELPLWQEWLEHPGLDDYWRAIRVDDCLPDFDVPAMHVTGWFDDDQAGALLAWDRMRVHPEQTLVIGPWDHGGTRTPQRHLGGVDFGADAVVDVLAVHVQWYDRQLRGRGEAVPRVRLFLTGRDGWVATTDFPPPGGTVRRLFLGSGAALTDDAGDAHGGCDSYAYDPADPVPALVDEDVYGSAVETPLDRRFQMDRPDVLAYTSVPFAQEAIVCGIPWMTLHAASDCPDTDWMIALHDVAPDGTCLQLAQGRMRARFRKGLDREVLLEPDAVEHYEIELSAVGHVVRAGHRVRVTVTSSDFPTWDRNANTGATIGTDTTFRIATNTVHHTSSIALPIADDGALQPYGRMPLVTAEEVKPTV